MRKLNHPLAVLRFVLGKTQDEFGQLVGVSGNYIKKIELGKRPLTPAIGETIYSMFGVSPNHLKYRLAPQGTYVWKVEVAALYANTQCWQQIRDLHEKDALHMFRRVVAPALCRRVESAMMKHRAVAFMMALERWLVGAVAEFGLTALAPSERYTRGHTLAPGLSYVNMSSDKKTLRHARISKNVRLPHAPPDHLLEATRGISFFRSQLKTAQAA